MTSILEYAPKYSPEEAEQIGRDLFGISGTATKLPSERDQNFLLTTDDGNSYVLKIANSNETFDILDMQNKAMLHMARFKEQFFIPAEGVCPDVCPTNTGDRIGSIKGKNGNTHFVRLLTYLPGKPFAETNPHHSELLEGLGRFFGCVDRSLHGFDHSAGYREFHWDIKHASKIINHLHHTIENEGDRKIVMHYLDRYEASVKPRLPELRQATIHNDGNDYNVLVVAEDSLQSRVDGVIDFGDMVHTHLVNELAITCAYAMLEKENPLSAAGCVVKGYHSVYPLEDVELLVLFDLICMRLCMSVCHAADQYRAEPDNEYLRISEKPAWDLIRRLSNFHPRFAGYLFRQAAGLPPVPQTEKVVSWLDRSRDKLASVIDLNLSGDKYHVLDLSVGSPMIEAGDDVTDMTFMADKIFDTLRENRARTGVGRYDEARCFNAWDKNCAEIDLNTEQRTVHLGIDLYQEAGSQVYACCAGKIHSFRNNRARFDYGPTIVLEHATDEGIPFFTLYGHLSQESLEGLSVGTSVAKGEAIAAIGDSNVNGGWPPHLHFQIITDMLGENGNFTGVALPSQRSIWKNLSPDPNLILGIPQERLIPDKKNVETIVQFRSRHIGRNLSISYRRPLKIVRGRAQYLFDEDGRAFLDGVNNVSHVGHCHPQVVAAGQHQMAVLNTNTRYLHDNIVAYAEQLLDTFPDPLSVCFFVCTGSEANELAFRLARTYTGQQDIITLDGSYHGNTNLLIDISPYKHGGPGGRGAPSWVHTVEMPDGYRGPHKGTGKVSGRQYAAHVKAAVEKLRAIGKGVGAFICESILGCGGQVVLPDGYMKEAFEHVRKAGGLCIADEIQVGFGRAGSHFWAFETQDVVPDIVTLGKPTGNGHPLAVVVTTPEIAEVFNNGMEYFNTFGGNPVSCAVGMAVLDVVKKERLQENARLVGEKLIKGFINLQGKYPLIGDVRGLGLFIGIELVKNRETLEPAAEHADYIINRLQDYNMLLSTDGPLHNVLKLKPPMVFSEKNAEELITALDRILSEDCLQI
jgi:4-aminobutyrate aminotransferase-like enzyme/Ser/Thr protein kinase RdoA (MazF antagonist)